ncbi:cingulin-like isoform X1 [Mugil cephalus]|uniref:cingulin-like isoform X1 n=1 Tax=Mugil cephalus TaxID=48193 RepID=UPI001FB670B7|nr:cingulin-like isoform X1 [Mugil cephalus]
MKSTASVLLLLCCSFRQGWAEASVRPQDSDVLKQDGVQAVELPVLWDELLGLRELVLSMKSEEVERRQALRTLESRLRDREVEAEQQRRSLGQLQETVEGQTEQLRRTEDNKKLETEINSRLMQRVEEVEEQSKAVAAQLTFLQTRLRASENTVEQLRRKSTVLAARLCNTESLMEELRTQISEFPVSNSSSATTPDESESQLNIRLQQLINNSEDRFSELSKKLNSSQLHLDELRRNSTDQSGRLVSVENQLMEVERRCSVESANVSVLSDRLNKVEHRLDELKTTPDLSRSSPLEEHLSDVKNRLLQLETNSSELFSRLRVSQKQLEDLKTENTDQTSKLMELQRKLNMTESLQDKVNTELFSRLRVSQKQLEDLKTENTALQVRLQDDEDQLDVLKTQNTVHDTELSSVALRLNRTEGWVDELRTLNSVRAAELISVSDRLMAAERDVEEFQVRLMNELNLEAEDQMKVAFSAGLTNSGSVGPFDEETALIFSKTIVNVGRAYNQTAGVFTAPVRGVYIFSFTVADYLKGYMGVYLYRNNQPITFNLDLNDHGGYASTSNAVALQLEDGDRVQLSLPASYRLYDDTRNFSVFSGFLLFTL